ncbi:MAG TPA: hypothetical protein VIH25_05460 [Steroidobacteraceae bacterium]
MTEWLKLMLEEIARKQAEQDSARAEEALRAQERRSARDPRSPPERREPAVPSRDSR